MIRDALRAMLTRHERLKLRVYDDATGLPIKPGYTLAGHPTIGVGRCLDINGITESEAATLLEHDIDAVLTSAGRYRWFDKLSDNRKLVICSMIFNLGPTDFSKFTRMMFAINAGNFEQAASEMLSSRWASQVGKRAVELAALMRSG